MASVASFVCSSPFGVSWKRRHTQINAPIDSAKPQRARVVAARKNQDKNVSQSQRRSRRKTAADISRDREHRARGLQRRRPLIALWSGAILAESEDYEFVDGRFFFPSKGVKWEYLQDTGQRKHLNPIGSVRVYDIVFHSESVKHKGKIVARSRGAVLTFDGVKRTWRSMEGYTCFSKGVDVVFKPPGFQQGLIPGQVRVPGGKLLHASSNGTVWEDLAVVPDGCSNETGDCAVDGDFYQ